MRILFADVMEKYFYFFFSSRRRHTRCGRDWSSDVCSSDLADPAFVVPPGGLLDPDYIKQRGELIRIDASIGEAAAGTPPEHVARTHRVPYGEHAALEFPSTSHISVVDRDGNAVAMTTTIEDVFGSRLMTEAGFLLNNELTDFSFVPVVD